MDAEIAGDLRVEGRDPDRALTGEDRPAVVLGEHLDTGADPLELFETAVRNATPLVEVSTRCMRLAGASANSSSCTCTASWNSRSLVRS